MWVDVGKTVANVRKIEREQNKETKGETDDSAGACFYLEYFAFSNNVTFLSCPSVEEVVFTTSPDTTENKIKDSESEHETNSGVGG